MGFHANDCHAEVARKVGERCDSVEIVEGDAVSLLPSDATALVLFNPFGSDVLAQFFYCMAMRCESGTRLFYPHPEHRSVIDARGRLWMLRGEQVIKPKNMGGNVLLEYELNKRGLHEEE